MFAKLFPLLILSLVLSACGKPPILNKLKAITETKLLSSQKTGISFTSVWIILPSIDELSALDLTFSKELEPYTLEAELYMPDHGHGSSPIVIEKDVYDSKLYHLSELSLFMTGHWVLTIKLMSKGQEIERWEQDIQL